MSYRDLTPEEEAKLVLKETTCALCPNRIDDTAYGIITDQEVVKLLAEKNPDSTVLEGPNGLFMLVHHSCFNAVSLIYGGTR